MKREIPRVGFGVDGKLRFINEVWWDYRNWHAFLATHLHYVPLKYFSCCQVLFNDLCCVTRFLVQILKLYSWPRLYTPWYLNISRNYFIFGRYVYDNLSVGPKKILSAQNKYLLFQLLIIVGYLMFNMVEHFCMLLF